MVNKQELHYREAGETKIFKHSDLQRVVEAEKEQPLCLAPQLKRRFLNPNNLGRLSTKPALAVINKKTIAALQFYSSEEFDMSGTSILIRKFLKA